MHPIRFFLPTASLFDLLGLARFLQATPDALPGVVWHASFHYGFMEGREPDYEMQMESRLKIHRQLEYLLENLPADRVRFYGTTDKLVQQFNRLGLARFEVLPFPADGDVFQNSDRGRANRPFRITCAGYLRREKGKSHAGKFVQGIWKDELSTGRMQLVAQTNRRQVQRMLPDYNPSLRSRFARFFASRSPIPWRFPTNLDDVVQTRLCGLNTP